MYTYIGMNIGCTYLHTLAKSAFAQRQSLHLAASGTYRFRSALPSSSESKSYKAPIRFYPITFKNQGRTVALNCRAYEVYLQIMGVIVVYRTTYVHVSSNIT